MNRSRTRALFAVALLGLAGMGFSRANAQEPPPLPPILEPGEAEELASKVVAQVMSAAADALAPPQTNPMTPANAGLARQPEPTPIDPDRSGDRRSSRRSGRDYSNQSRSSRGDEARGGIASAGSTPAPGNSRPSDTRPDFSNFRIIAERNIFDPNRRGYRAPTAREKPKTVESISLVGVMSYEKGTFAFFDGTSAAYRKALKENDSIAGYRLASINSRAVQLATGTNEIELQVGMQLRREDEGAWTPSRRTDAFATSGAAPNATSSPAPTPQTDSAAGGSESEVLKRLRERRERE